MKIDDNLDSSENFNYEETLYQGLRSISHKVRSYSDYPDNFFTDLITTLSSTLKADVFINLIEMIASNGEYPEINTDKPEFNARLLKQIDKVFHQFCRVIYEKRVCYTEGINNEAKYNYEVWKLKDMFVELKRLAHVNNFDLTAFFKSHNKLRQMRKDSSMAGNSEQPVEA